MKKWFKTLLLAVGLILALAPAALAGTVTGDQLRQVFPQAPAPGKTITRGEFAALLARAAGMQVKGNQADIQGDAWYSPAVMALKAKGVIRGYPDGGLHTDQPVTLLEAAVMVSRVLGLPDGVAAPEVKGSLGRESWGYTPYAWLVRAGLLQPGQDASAVLTVDEGVAFLARVFGSDPEAEKIVQAAKQAQAKVKDLKFAGSMAISARLRPEAVGKVSGVSGVSMQGNIESEFSYPLSLHQKMDMTLNLPAEKTPGKDLAPGGKMQMTMEQYLVDGTMYQKVEAPGMAEPQWMKLPKNALPDLEALVEQSRNAAGLPPGLKDSFHFRYLGEGIENGHKVHRIAYYGRIDDWQALIKALPGGLTTEMEQALNQAGGVLKSISFWGVEAVGVEDNLTYASEMTSLVAFADKYQEEIVPLETMTINVKVTDYQYNSGVKIQVPAEALTAPEVPLTPSQPDVKSSGSQQMQG
ncbi:S-layer homology domain-containing protein [Neomoorella thermoacetica]|uniref:S-layer homology domain-containing protein n=1 Tax=Neomoorella thermoacetica TaxID=1525 RepID=UPI0008FB0D1A|nr:S-layer homology domain-containing protein [Moorella thermoacetica]OIQ54801.1 surface layer protein precursor [Moorella thermoacetica]